MWLTIQCTIPSRIGCHPASSVRSSLLFVTATKGVSSSSSSIKSGMKSLLVVFWLRNGLTCKFLFECNKVNCQEVTVPIFQTLTSNSTCSPIVLRPANEKRRYGNKISSVSMRTISVIIFVTDCQRQRQSGLWWNVRIRRDAAGTSSTGSRGERRQPERSFCPQSGHVLGHDPAQPARSVSSCNSMVRPETFRVDVRTGRRIRKTRIVWWFPCCVASFCYSYPHPPFRGLCYLFFPLWLQLSISTSSSYSVLFTVRHQESPSS